MADSSERPLVPVNIRDLSPYVAGKTIAEVEEEYQPPQISKLASNENRLGCSPNVKHEVVKAMQESRIIQIRFPGSFVRFWQRRIMYSRTI